MGALARGYLARYTTLDDLIRALREADALGKLKARLAFFQRPHLLVVDEVSYSPLDRADANRFFQLVNRRYTRGSMIVTSNKVVSEWAELFGEEALAAAILDRLLHDAEHPDDQRPELPAARTTRCAQGEPKDGRGGLN